MCLKLDGWYLKHVKHCFGANNPIETLEKATKINISLSRLCSHQSSEVFPDKCQH